MRITKIKTEKVVTNVDIICNKCGQSTSKNIGLPKNKMIHDPYGILEYKYYGGYYSEEPFRDSMCYIFSLCESCVGKIFESFVIPAEEVEPKYRNQHHPRQIKINEISKITSVSALAQYLLDEDNIIRAYTKSRIKYLESK